MESDEKTEKLKRIGEELEEKRKHLSFIENKIPILQGKKKSHVSAKRFRDAGVVHKEIQSLAKQKETAEGELVTMQMEETELRNVCASHMETLKQLKSSLKDSTRSRDETRFNQLIYTEDWINKFMKYVKNEDKDNETIK
eukprot:UN32395